jgi:hypothetical protein
MDAHSTGHLRNLVRHFLAFLLTTDYFFFTLFSGPSASVVMRSSG